MNPAETPQLLLLLVVILGSARIAGILARWTGQPAVLGELLAGVVLGASVLGMVDTGDAVLQAFAQLGIVILLFEIGLETDLRKLVAVGDAAAAVAVVGLVLPFGMGYGLCRWLGIDHLEAFVVGATLSVTGVGVTGRLLSDLGRLDDVEGRIVLGAAIIDDMVGLVILAVVGALAQGESLTTWDVTRIAMVTCGFLVGTLVLGVRLVPPLMKWLSRIDIPGTSPMLALIVALVLGWLAAVCGSAIIIGAFAAGLLLRRTPQAQDIQLGFVHLGRFFVPVFFIMVGAAVDLRLLNPTVPANRAILLMAGSLFVIAIIGKLVAGYAPFWFPCRKLVIGVAMVPRGAVGLVFAQVGLSSGVLNSEMFSAVTLMVILTTVVAPPMLRFLLPRKERPPGTRPKASEQLISEP